MSRTDSIVGRVVLGRYRILRELARGGMGAVYLARIEGAAGFVKPAVVKQIRPEYEDQAHYLALFQREARILAKLRHPAIVSVLDFADEDGSHLMALDYVHGHHLGRWLQFIRRTAGGFPIDRAVHIVLTVLEALQYVHTARDLDGQPLGVLHRDIKPSNILIDVDGQVKLVDFGIARAEADQTGASSQQSAFRGTLPYMAPELFRGGEPTAAADVYSCGVVLHELLTGRNEFVGKHPTATVGLVISHTPSPIERVRADVSPGLRETVARVLAKEPEHRYRSAAELAEALRESCYFDPQQVMREIRTTAVRDFHDPRFGALTGADELSAREEALHEVSGKIVTAIPAPASTAAVAPVEDVATAPRSSPPRTGWRPVRIVIASVLAVALAGAAVALTLLRHPESPEVVVVRGTVRTGASVDSGPAPAETPTAAKEPAGEPAAVAAKTAARSSPGPGAARPLPAAKPSGSDVRLALTRSFARKRAAVETCFVTHAADSAGVAEVTVDFRLNPQGQVTVARVLPPALAATPLGSCIEGIARTTSFGPQAPPSFTIPIAVGRKK
jgi:eukaryotic-like serine/threonine-protein kinase